MNWTKEECRLYLDEFRKAVISGDFAELKKVRKKIEKKSKNLIEHIISLYFDNNDGLKADHYGEIIGMLKTIQRAKSKTNHLKDNKYNKSFNNYKQLIWGDEDEKSLNDKIIDRKNHMDLGKKHKNDLGGDLYKYDDKIFLRIKNAINGLCELLANQEEISYLNVENIIETAFTNNPS